MHRSILYLRRTFNLFLSLNYYEKLKRRKLETYARIKQYSCLFTNDRIFPIFIRISQIPHDQRKIKVKNYLKFIYKKYNKFIYFYFREAFDIMNKIGSTHKNKYSLNEEDKQDLQHWAEQTNSVIIPNIYFILFFLLK